MNKKNSKKLNLNRKSGRAALVALVAAASMTLGSASAYAAVVCGPGANIPVPATFSGVYINFVTGTATPTTAGSPGWDFGPWGAANLNFFWASAPANSSGGVTLDTTTYAKLPAGATVSAASTFITSAAAAATAGYQAGNTTDYLGLRFFNEATSAINYGWALITTTAATGHPATVVQYCYQNDGSAITTGTTPVSLQNFSVD